MVLPMVPPYGNWLDYKVHNSSLLATSAVHCWPEVVIVAFLTWLGWFIPREFGLFPENWIPKGMDKFELAI
ncbi:hypothetical protein COP2_028232 [Malus domestica]